MLPVPQMAAQILAAQVFRSVDEVKGWLQENYGEEAEDVAIITPLVTPIVITQERTVSVPTNAPRSRQGEKTVLPVAHVLSIETGERFALAQHNGKLHPVDFRTLDLGTRQALLNAVTQPA